MSMRRFYAPGHSMILVLGGTTEAREVGDLLADAGIAGILSLAGATKAPLAQRLPVRSGGFGGAQAMADYITAMGITAVIDALHPFARSMSWRSCEVCATLGVPLVRIERPAWRPGPKDRWFSVQSPAQVAALVPPSARILALTGPKSARALKLEGYSVVCRRIEPPGTQEQLPHGWRWCVSPPPYSAKSDADLMRRHAITLLIAKNSGGDASAGKLQAARELELPVIMIERGPLPSGMAVVNTPRQALGSAALAATISGA